MKVIHIKDIQYKLDDKSKQYTLPVSMSFNIDDNFNKYTDIAKYIKEYIGYEPSFYMFEEGDLIT